MKCETFLANLELIILNIDIGMGMGNGNGKVPSMISRTTTHHPLTSNYEGVLQQKLATQGQRQ